jgi:hypothetical protein
MDLLLKVITHTLVLTPNAKLIIMVLSNLARMLPMFKDSLETLLKKLFSKGQFLLLLMLQTEFSNSIMKVSWTQRSVVRLSITLLSELDSELPTLVKNMLSFKTPGVLLGETMVTSESSWKNSVLESAVCKELPSGLKLITEQNLKSNILLK